MRPTAPRRLPLVAEQSGWREYFYPETLEHADGVVQGTLRNLLGERDDERLAAAEPPWPATAPTSCASTPPWSRPHPTSGARAPPGAHRRLPGGPAPVHVAPAGARPCRTGAPVLVIESWVRAMHAQGLSERAITEHARPRRRPV